MKIKKFSDESGTCLSVRSKATAISYLLIRVIFVIPFVPMIVILICLTLTTIKVRIAIKMTKSIDEGEPEPCQIIAVGEFSFQFSNL